MHAFRGQAQPRTEDARFVTGAGEYLDDIRLPDTAVLMLLRSPAPSGVIRTLDTGAARALAGVLAVYTIDDLDAAGVRDLPANRVPASAAHAGHEPIGQPALARGVVRYVGEPVAAVVAESRTQARAALDAIELDIEPGPAVGDIEHALADAAPRVHDAVSGNLLGVAETGDAAATEAAFAAAHRVVELDVVNNRVAPSTIEPRGCLASFDAAANAYTLYQGCQGVHGLRDYVTACMPIAATQLRVVCPDVGGGFGLKLFLQCETVSVLHATRALGRPVRWVASRSESFVSDLHGRDHVTHAELALDDDGTFLAMRVTVNSNVGAYQSQYGALVAYFGASMTTGCYRIPACYTRTRFVMTHTVPVDAYRGAGRPEAAYLLERLVDKAARESGIAVDEIRRRNFIPADAFPYRNAAGSVYDSGDYLRIMDACMRRADWQGFDARRASAAEAGLLRGIGLATYVEACAGYGSETVRLRFDDRGQLIARVGTQSTGQGHETSYAQLAADALALPLAQVTILQGDTQTIPTGAGTGGSRTMAIGGVSLAKGVAAMIVQGQYLAAAMRNVAPASLSFADGAYHGDGAPVALADVVARSHADALPAGVEPGLAAAVSYQPDAGTYPNGCHICEVDVDPDTGAVTIVRYTVHDDVGNVINPLLLAGQIMGGIAQGLGQALSEHAVFDGASALPLADSFTRYAIPKATNLPPFDFDFTPVPTPRNPLGVKGAGEAGTIGAPPALVNAVVDALYEHGVAHLDMPLSSMAVWRALHGRGARRRRRAA